MNLLDFIKPLQNELRQLLNMGGYSSIEEYMSIKEIKVETNEEKIAFILGQMAVIEGILQTLILEEENEELLVGEEE
jgi:hypothetical protein|tara:strand:- start:5 stop:235 length:231 start_codon:yes stop_codon:yes gene_type:complete